MLCPSSPWTHSPLFGTLCRLPGLAGHTGQGQWQRLGLHPSGCAVVHVPTGILTPGPQQPLTSPGHAVVSVGCRGDPGRLTPKPSSAGLGPCAPPDGQGQPRGGLLENSSGLGPPMFRPLKLAVVLKPAPWWTAPLPLHQNVTRRRDSELLSQTPLGSHSPGAQCKFKAASSNSFPQHFSNTPVEVGVPALGGRQGGPVASLSPRHPGPGLQWGPEGSTERGGLESREGLGPPRDAPRLSGNTTPAGRTHIRRRKDVCPLRALKGGWVPVLRPQTVVQRHSPAGQPGLDPKHLWAPLGRLRSEQRLDSPVLSLPSVCTRVCVSTCVSQHVCVCVGTRRAIHLVQCGPGEGGLWDPGPPGSPFSLEL